MRGSNAPVTYILIREKAKMLADTLVERYKDASADLKVKLHYEQLKKFDASSGWCTKFCDIFHLVSGTLAGELSLLFLFLQPMA